MDFGQCSTEAHLGVLGFGDLKKTFCRQCILYVLNEDEHSMCAGTPTFSYSARFKNKDVFVVEQTISGNVLLKHHCLFKVEKVVMFMQVICCVDCLKQILIYLCTLNNNLL